MTGSLNQYYRFHSCIYDATRWSFLFGRDQTIRCLGAVLEKPVRICEIGCGTGKNLIAMHHRFPDAQITGMDLSTDMLARAQKSIGFTRKIRLIHQTYDRPLNPDQPCDIILFSYCLSMIPTGITDVLANAREDLSPSGSIAVVDFHSSDYNFFRKWMKINHVRMEGHLLPVLKSMYSLQMVKVNQAYGGLWSWFVFIGRSPGL